MADTALMGQAITPGARLAQRPAPAKRTHRRWALPAAGGLVFFAIWELIVDAGLVDRVFLPAPSSVVVTGWEILQTPDFYSDVSISFREFGVGFVLALLVAIPLGLVTGWYRRLNHLLDPLLIVGYATPRVVLLPWIFMFFGIGFQSKVVMVFLGVFFPLIINVMAGVRALDAGFLMLARSFGASQLNTFRDVVLPGSVPFVVSGIRLGIGTGFTGLIIAELTSAHGGIGYMIHVAGHTLQTPRYFVGLTVISFAALALTGLTVLLERRVARWRPRLGG